MPAADSTPIVCTLSPTAMAPRLATYDLAAAVTVAAIVALEQECCTFLDFKSPQPERRARSPLPSHLDNP